MLSEGFHWFWRSVLQILMRYQFFRWLLGFIEPDKNAPLQIESEEEQLPGMKKKQEQQKQQQHRPPAEISESVVIRTGASAMGNAGSAEIVSNQIIRRPEVVSPSCQ